MSDKLNHQLPKLVDMTKIKLNMVSLLGYVSVSVVELEGGGSSNNKARF